MFALAAEPGFTGKQPSSEESGLTVAIHVLQQHGGSMVDEPPGLMARQWHGNLALTSGETGPREPLPSITYLPGETGVAVGAVRRAIAVWSRKDWPPRSRAGTRSPAAAYLTCYDNSQLN